MPKIEIVCLANSRKLSNWCVAGVRTDGGGWVRPVSGGPGGALSAAQVTLDTGKRAQLLDIIEIEMLRPAPQCHQPENWLIADRRWRRVGTCTQERLEALLARTGGPAGSLMGSSGDRVLRSALDERPVPRSLEGVIPEEVVWTRTKSLKRRPQLRARFDWHDVGYILVVTDPVWESKFSALPEADYRSDQIGLAPTDGVLLTISLGEPMANGFCFKLVAGVVVLSSTAPGSPPDAFGADSGSTLRELTKAHFGTAFSRSGRFGISGWTYEGAKPWACPACGQALHAARKPYQSNGTTYRYWALMCPRCRRVWAPDEFDPEVTKLIYRDSPGTTWGPLSGDSPAPQRASLVGPLSAARSAPGDRCKHGNAKAVCDACVTPRSARAVKAFRENQRRVLSGESFRGRKASGWSRRPRKRK
jgi:hypothetical protein